LITAVFIDLDELAILRYSDFLLSTWMTQEAYFCV